MVRDRLDAADVMMPGKKGPHTFRHARAVSLLRAAVPLKAIGDILGHRSALSTGAYLKLAHLGHPRSCQFRIAILEIFIAI